MVLRTDEYSRPTELGASMSAQGTYADLESGILDKFITVGIEETIQLSVSYGKIYLSFAIPQEILEEAQEAEF